MANSISSVKVSFITTLLNEEQTIGNLLQSINEQSLLPDEVIIVDGGSTDKTLKIITKFQNSNPKLKTKVIQVKGNRSVGRNEAIRVATGEIIVCSDSGCVLDKNWIAEIIKPFKNNKIDVVAGYYEGLSKNIFQKCMIPYALVMPDQVNSANFLPATRSMAFKKSIWQRTGGFNEKLSHNEDYEFAKRVKKNGFEIDFAKKAIVYWIPPNNIKKAFIMFFRFAFGDSEAGIYRPKALLVLLRYLFALILLGFTLITKNLFTEILLVVLIINYLVWSVMKNYWYVKKIEALIILPLLQIISDTAVILGTLFGFIKMIGN